MIRRGNLILSLGATASLLMMPFFTACKTSNAVREDSTMMVGNAFSDATHRQCGCAVTGKDCACSDGECGGSCGGGDVVGDCEGDSYDKE